MKISSEVRLDTVKYLHELKPQEEPQKKEMFHSTDKVDISEEGASRLRDYLSQKADTLYQKEEYSAVELDGTGTDVWSQELSIHRANLLQDIRKNGLQYGFEEIMSASLEAYATLYEKINEGYENGTREIWVADGKDGKRKLSKDEEIERLNNAYKREIEWQTMVMNSRKETEKAKNITFSINQTNVDVIDDKAASDALSKLMIDMKERYLSYRKNGDYDKNIQITSNVASSILGRFALNNHMVNVFEGISLLK